MPWLEDKTKNNNILLLHSLNGEFQYTGKRLEFCVFSLFDKIVTKAIDEDKASPYYQ